jgi:hypothetical protein
MARTQVPGSQILDATITDADVAAANKDGAAGTASMRTLGTGAAQAAAGNDSRLSDARTPTAHASTHRLDGTDTVLTQFSPTGSVTIPDGYCVIVPGDFTLASGQTLTIAATGVLQTGGHGNPIVPMIAQQILAVDTATVTLSNIPQNFTNLILTFCGADDQSGGAAQAVNVQFNSDASSSYTSQQLTARSTTVAGAGSVAATKGQIGASTGTANQTDANAAFRVTFFSYANAQWNKLWFSHFTTFDVATGASEILLGHQSGRWKNVAPITRMDVTLAAGKFKAGCVFTLLGE